MSNTGVEELAAYFSVDELAATGVRENYNVAPTQAVPVVTEDEHHHRVLDVYHWGLIPSWAKDPKIGNRMINARAETVVEKPAYRKAFAARRCIIPAGGFYEWKKGKDAKTKQPYFIHPTGEPVFAFAGLWERWRHPESDQGPSGPIEREVQWVRSCAIITGGANGVVHPIHDRMPVVLPREHWNAWLDPGNDDVEALKKLLVPAPDGSVDAYPVSTRVNSPKNNTPENLNPDPNPVT